MANHGFGGESWEAGLGNTPFYSGLVIGFWMVKVSAGDSIIKGAGVCDGGGDQRIESQADVLFAVLFCKIFIHFKETHQNNVHENYTSACAADYRFARKSHGGS